MIKKSFAARYGGSAFGVNAIMSLIMLLLNFPVFAQESHVSGFATLGVSCFSSDEADYFRDEQPEGPGLSRRCDTGLDSLAGVQLDTIVSSHLEAGLQLTSYQDPEGKFDPKLTLAQLRWQLNDQLMLRLGRTHDPNFLHSEYRNVHYLMTGVRPVSGLYNLLASYVFDGAELLYQFPWMSWNMEMHMVLGQSEFDAYWSDPPRTDPVDVKDGWFLGLTMEKNDLRLKAGVTGGRVSYQPLALLPLVSMLPADVADDISIENRDLQLLSLGAHYDDGTWVIEGEWARRTIDGWIQDQQVFYVTSGRRYAEWMPYVTFSRVDSSGPGTNQADLDPVTGDPLAALLSYTDYSRTSYILGVSRDLGENMIVKCQVESIHPDSGSNGGLSNLSENYNFRDPDSETLISLNLNFLF